MNAPRLKDFLMVVFTFAALTVLAWWLHPHNLNSEAASATQANAAAKAGGKALANAAFASPVHQTNVVVKRR